MIEAEPAPATINRQKLTVKVKAIRLVIIPPVITVGVHREKIRTLLAGSTSSAEWLNPCKA